MMPDRQHKFVLLVLFAAEETPIGEEENATVGALRFEP